MNLENQLRALADAINGHDAYPRVLEALRTAARIGAEIEREACAETADRVGQQTLVGIPYRTARTIAAEIRARGGK